MEDLWKILSDADDRKIANQENEINGVNVSPQQHCEKKPVPDVTNTATLESDKQEFCTQMFEKLMRISANLLKLPAHPNDSNIVKQEVTLMWPLKLSEISNDMATDEELITEGEELARLATLPPEVLAAKIQNLEDRVYRIGILAEKLMQRGRKVDLLKETNN